MKIFKQANVSDELAVEMAKIQRETVFNEKTATEQKRLKALELLTNAAESLDKAGLYKAADLVGRFIEKVAVSVRAPVSDVSNPLGRKTVDFSEDAEALRSYIEQKEEEEEYRRLQMEHGPDRKAIQQGMEEFRRKRNVKLPADVSPEIEPSPRPPLPESEEEIAKRILDYGDITEHLRKAQRDYKFRGIKDYLPIIMYLYTASQNNPNPGIFDRFEVKMPDWVKVAAKVPADYLDLIIKNHLQSVKSNMQELEAVMKQHDDLLQPEDQAGAVHVFPASMRKDEYVVREPSDQVTRFENKELALEFARKLVRGETWRIIEHDDPTAGRAASRMVSRPKERVIKKEGPSISVDVYPVHPNGDNFVVSSESGGTAVGPLSFTFPREEKEQARAKYNELKGRYGDAHVRKPSAYTVRTPEETLQFKSLRKALRYARSLSDNITLYSDVAAKQAIELPPEEIDEAGEEAVEETKADLSIPERAFIYPDPDKRGAYIIRIVDDGETVSVAHADGPSEAASDKEKDKHVKQIAKWVLDEKQARNVMIGLPGGYVPLSEKLEPVSIKERKKQIDVYPAEHDGSTKWFVESEGAWRIFDDKDKAIEFAENASEKINADVKIDEKPRKSPSTRLQDKDIGKVFPINTIDGVKWAVELDGKRAAEFTLKKPAIELARTKAKNIEIIEELPKLAFVYPAEHIIDLMTKEKTIKWFVVFPDGNWNMFDNKDKAVMFAEKHADKIKVDENLGPDPSTRSVIRTKQQKQIKQKTLEPFSTQKEEPKSKKTFTPPKFIINPPKPKEEVSKEEVSKAIEMLSKPKEPELPKIEPPKDIIRRRPGIPQLRTK